MSGSHKPACEDKLRAAVLAELGHVRRLGANDGLVMLSSNLGAYEAVLIIMLGGDAGVPIYEAVTSVQSRYSSQAGVLGKIKSMRSAGLLDERPGPKKSQVCLSASEEIKAALTAVLLDKHRDVM